MRTNFRWALGESPVKAETARSHVFTRDISHASICNQHVKGIPIVKIVCECFLP